MKKSLLVATIVLVGLLVGGCSLHSGTTSSTTGLSTSTSATIAQSTATSGETSSTEAESSSTTQTTVPASTTTTTSGPTTRFEQDNPKITYKGAWKTTIDDDASGHSFKFANSSGCSVTISFVGTHLTLLAKKSPKYGKAKITLDGKVLGTVDLYSSTAKFRQKVWGSGNLKQGAHTVVISWTGTKRGAATGTYIDIDAVDMVGTLQ